MQGLVKGTLDKWGRIDTLVCNAAVNPYFGPLAGISDDAFDKIMSSNIKSNLWLCNFTLPAMAEKGGGSVVIVSSIGGLRGSAQLGAYGISKAADMQLTRSLAVEWGPKNIRVNCVAPGLVKTDFARALWEDPERLKRTVSTAPLRRIGEPHEIGGVVAFLASQGVDLHDGHRHRRRRRRDDRRLSSVSVGIHLASALGLWQYFERHGPTCSDRGAEEIRRRSARERRNGPLHFRLAGTWCAATRQRPRSLHRL